MKCGRPDVQEILEQWLKEHGYDGLVNPDETCGCVLDDLCPCGTPSLSECVAGYKITRDDPEWEEYGNNFSEWVMITDTPKRLKKREFVNLGYANSWADTPDIVKACEAKGHTPDKVNLGNCLNEYRCEACGYLYKVDSSG